MTLPWTLPSGLPELKRAPNGAIRCESCSLCHVSTNYSSAPLQTLLLTPALTGRTGCLVAWPMARAAGLAAVRKLLDSPYMVYADADGVELVCEEGVNRRRCDPTSSRRPRRLTVVDLRKMRARKGKSRRQLGSLSASARPASPAYVAAPLAAFVRLRRSFQNGAESEGVVPRHISDLVEHVAVSRPPSVPISHPCTEPPTPVRCQVQSIHNALHRLALSMEAK